MTNRQLELNNMIRPELSEVLDEIEFFGREGRIIRL